MKISKIVQFTFVAVVLGLAMPARADTMSVPSKEKAAFTFDVPPHWKPKADKSDESVEASQPDDKAYLIAWVTKASDEKALTKDLESTLKDSLKSIDPDSKMEEVDQNGSHFYVITGSGLDKREGTKVKFLVAIFETGPDQAGIVYTDYDANLPADTMTVLKGILNSIKVAKK